MDLVIVESPNKTKKLAEILGSNYSLIATAGHFRDLPHKEMGIDIDSGSFALSYEFTPPAPIPNKPGSFFPGGKDRIDRIKALVKNASKIYIATDLDREGEAIAWHVKDALNLNNNNYKRIVFNEITEEALLNAIKNTRLIDDKMVESQEGRRAADRLVGYMVSPVLSDLMGFKASSGRVQSVALRLIVDREREINKFKPIAHFGAVAFFDEKKWSAEWDTAPFLTGDSQYIFDEKLAQLAASFTAFKVIASETKPRREAPPAPFSTSTLLQAASIKLNFNSDKTSKLAQKLFEQGVITYIRTDTNNLAESANIEIREYAQSKGFSVAEKMRKFPSKDGAQEAHEAIRPTHIEADSEGSTDDEKTLYKFIRDRALASQLADAVYSVNSLVLEAKKENETFTFKASGKTLVSEGWRKLTKDDSTNEDQEEENTNGKVPQLAVGSTVTAGSAKVLNKSTKAPSRYTEASLVKKLEAEQIGRPATYSSIITTITRRKYVEEKAKKFVPTEIGCKIIDVLVDCEFEFVELGFTQMLEEQLDKIYTNEATYTDVIQRLYDSLVRDLERLSAKGMLMPTHDCPECGSRLKRVDGKNGVFWGCSQWEAGCKCIMDDLNGKPVPRKVHLCPVCSSKLASWKDIWFCTNKELEPKCPAIPNYRGAPMAAALYKCPVNGCGKPMRRIKGTNGFFWGCTGYSDGCKGSLPDKAGKPDREGKGKAKATPSGGSTKPSKKPLRRV